VIVAGYQVFRTSMAHRQPVLRLSKDFKWCSDKFRAEMNAWLLERFGEREYALFAGDKVFVGPAMYERLRVNGEALLFEVQVQRARGLKV
jgi:hypothetical protein